MRLEVKRVLEQYETTPGNQAAVFVLLKDILCACTMHCLGISDYEGVTKISWGERKPVGVMIRSDTNLPTVTEGYDFVILD